MRPILLTLLFAPIPRLSFATATASTLTKRAALPPLTYPICRRNLTYTPALQHDLRSASGMADLRAEEVEAVERLAEPAGPCEAEMLASNTAREEALADKAAEEKEKKKKEEEEVVLPKLSAADFRTYNSMAEHMEYFHNHFRHSWTILHSAYTTNRRPRNLSLKQFIATGLQFISHLSTHHAIEEMHIFPHLARKMPEFQSGANAAELLRQHRAIHAGMDVLEAYLQRCQSGETELELRVLGEKMEVGGWGEVLWKHLDQEVKTLGAENMRRYWTLEEMRRMPM